MTKILPHTKRFLLIFNSLKQEKKLPSNEVLAHEIGLNSGNSITEITKGRQNIGIDNIELFCKKYNADYEYMIGEDLSESNTNRIVSIDIKKFKLPKWQKRK